MTRLVEAAGALRHEQGLERDRHESTRAGMTGIETDVGDAHAQIEALETIRVEMQQEIKDLIKTAAGQIKEHDREVERHERTRLELAASQQSLADALAHLDQANESVEALENARLELQQNIKALAQTADELRREHGHEAEHHEQTQVLMADAETDLGSANEQIEALEAIRQDLLKEIAALSESTEELRQEHGFELQRHETTRAKFSAARESLADSETRLQQSHEKIEALQTVRQELQAEIAAQTKAMEKRR